MIRAPQRQGWQRWNGGKAPAMPKTVIDVICRDGSRFFRTEASVFLLIRRGLGRDFWHAAHDAADIIAWRKARSI